MTADFDAQIKALQDEIEAMREPLREQTEKWLAATAARAAEYWEAQARDLITQQPERAKGLGPQGMTNLKGGVHSLIASALERANRHFLEGENRWMWPHLQEDMVRAATGPDNMRARLTLPYR